MVVIAKKIKPKKYQLPDFDLQRLLDHIQYLVDRAPYGIIGLIIDLFCGAGGTSEGLEQALAENGEKGYCIITGINHDEKAIYSQAKNHPLAYYSTEDIRTAKLEFIKELIDICRKRWPQCPIIIWASLECTNLSNAKGGMSRDADSRTLAWHIFRYLRVLQPDGLWIENVKEFAQWGPMMEKIVMQKGKKSITLAKQVDRDKEMEFYQEYMNQGYHCYCPLNTKRKKRKKSEPLEAYPPIWVPIKHLKGTYYHPWVDKVKGYGYNYQDWLLNAADYGVPQNRVRFFPMFMRHGYKILRPEPTHAKNASKDLFSALQPHVAVRECLDFTEEGESIFTPGKIKAKASFKRYLQGLIKFCAGGKKLYQQRLSSGNCVLKVYPEAGQTIKIIAVDGSEQVVKEYFLAKHNSAPNGGVNAGSSVDEVAPTITCKTTSRLVDVQFLDVIYGTPTPSSLDRPAPTVRTKDGLALITPVCLINYQGKSDANSLDEASPTIMTKDKLALTNIEYFIVNQYSGGGQTDSLDKPAAAVTTNPKSRIVEVTPWIQPTSFSNPATSVEVPAPTVMASRKHHLLVTTYHGTNSFSTMDSPAPTVIARQDKAPLSMMEVEEGWFAIPVFKNDPDIVIQIKEFMAMYGIADIKTRMLMVKELLKIQSFPEGYFLAAGLTDQKKWVGNAVPPRMARKIGESMHRGLVDYMIKKLKLAA